MVSQIEIAESIERFYYHSKYLCKQKVWTVFKLNKVKTRNFKTVYKRLE